MALFNGVIIYDMSVCTTATKMAAWAGHSVSVSCFLNCCGEMKQATDPLLLLFSTKSCCLVAVKHEKCINNLSIGCYGCIYVYMYHCLKNNSFSPKMPLKNSVGYMYLQSRHWACAEQIESLAKLPLHQYEAPMVRSLAANKFTKIMHFMHILLII